MRQASMYVPGNVGEVVDHLNHMLLGAPKFRDKTGYFPDQNLEYNFQQLTGGLNNIREMLGEERYQELTRMSARMRTLFEADPDDKTGETLQGCKIIHEMEEILRQAGRASKAGMRAFENFPYEIVETNGENAVAVWEELKNAGRGVPVVLGDDLENSAGALPSRGIRPTSAGRGDSRRRKRDDFSG